MQIENIQNPSYPYDNKDISGLSVEYITTDSLDNVLKESSVLAIIGYGEKTTYEKDRRQFSLAMPVLGQPDLYEVWRSADTVIIGEKDGITLTSTDEYLFGSMILEDNDPDITTVAEEAYTKLVNTIRAEGFPHLLRMWNHFSRINKNSQGLERYQQFCLGRHNALDRLQMNESMLPAASAVGTQAPGLAIYFIAAKGTGKQIENPYQVSAFQYPEQYAPRSPSFSRAMYKKCRNKSCLYISGTASIKGHETKHAGDIRKQLDETLHNIDILLETGNREQELGLSSIRDLTLLKVYLRHTGDEPLVRSILLKEYGKDLPLLILHADICRDNLLLEVEGVYLG